MKKQILIKVFTLSVFVFLLGSFILYRSGSFNTLLFSDKTTIQTSHNGGEIRTHSIPPYDPAKEARLSSSKSLVMTDNDPYMISKKKQAYLTYMITNRSQYFQDSMRKLAKPLPPSFQFKLDSIRFQKITWFLIK